MHIEFVLLADGGSDQVLLPILRWLFVQHVPADGAIHGDFADLSVLRDPPRTLRERISRTMELFPCDVLLVHRDAEAQDPDRRYHEINVARMEANIGNAAPVVCIVPVRMTEAWLLFDSTAIRTAAGNPNGIALLELPADAETEADPKRVLFAALRDASELHGRRRKTFRPERARARVAELIDDFSPLRRLRAFRRLEKDLCAALALLFDGREIDGSKPGPRA